MLSSHWLYVWMFQQQIILLPFSDTKLFQISFTHIFNVIQNCVSQNYQGKILNITVGSNTEDSLITALWDFKNNEHISIFGEGVWQRRTQSFRPNCICYLQLRDLYDGLILFKKNLFLISSDILPDLMALNNFLIHKIVYILQHSNKSFSTWYMGHSGNCNEMADQLNK